MNHLRRPVNYSTNIMTSDFEDTQKKRIIHHVFIRKPLDKYHFYTKRNYLMMIGSIIVSSLFYQVIYDWVYAIVEVVFKRLKIIK
mmetsp:Transcript_41321/g.43234  ORF Transcript_41321/g.43234 Transcript_41321/m.43234 type:complete len:85 (-) Transcript_41321:11-265(-)